MEKQEFTDTMIEVIANLGNRNKEEISMTNKFDEIGGLWDSLDNVELVCAMEEALDVEIMEIDAEKIISPEFAGDDYQISDFIENVYEVLKSKL